MIVLASLWALLSPFTGGKELPSGLYITVEGTSTGSVFRRWEVTSGRSKLLGSAKGPPPSLAYSYASATVKDHTLLCYLAGEPYKEHPVIVKFDKKTVRTLSSIGGAAKVFFGPQNRLLCITQERNRRLSAYLVDEQARAGNKLAGIETAYWSMREPKAVVTKLHGNGSRTYILWDGKRGGPLTQRGAARHLGVLPRAYDEYEKLTGTKYRESNRDIVSSGSAQVAAVFGSALSDEMPATDLGSTVEVAFVRASGIKELRIQAGQIMPVGWSADAKFLWMIGDAGLTRISTQDGRSVSFDTSALKGTVLHFQPKT